MTIVRPLRAPPASLWIPTWRGMRLGYFLRSLSTQLLSLAPDSHTLREEDGWLAEEGTVVMTSRGRYTSQAERNDSPRVYFCDWNATVTSFSLQAPQWESERQYHKSRRWVLRSDGDWSRTGGMFGGLRECLTLAAFPRGYFARAETCHEGACV